MYYRMINNFGPNEKYKGKVDNKNEKENAM